MSFTTGTTMFNPYVLNIVDLQNTANSANGITTEAAVAGLQTATTNLQTATSNLQSMVDYTNKRVNADQIASFTDGGAVTFLSPIEAAAGQTTLSNVDASPYTLNVYGTVYASNYNSLCPMVFSVHDKKGIEFEALRITEEGCVGVGTFAPAEKLAVAGSARVDNNLTVGGSVTIEGDVVIKGRLRVEGGMF